MSDYSQLDKYVEPDLEKMALIEDVRPMMKLESSYIEMNDYDFKGNYVKYDYCLEAPAIKSIKICPKCKKRFDAFENFCPDCLVTLKYPQEMDDIKGIEINSKIEFKGSGDSSNILTKDNIELVCNFDFTIDDFNDIVHSIKAQGFRNLDNAIKDNSIDLDSLNILDKVLLFAKAFVSVEYKSYGEDLGYFQFNKIYVDDRQRKSLQITTLIHELSHFLLKEFLVHTTCKILDVNKNRHVEAVIIYILSNSSFNSLIDEYAAHSVEGRFTIFGYQDYSSFTAIQKDLDSEHVDIAKTIGNTFAIYIKELLEGFLDWDLREDIKTQFLKDTIESPDYRQLQLENCNKLSDEGFIKAIWLILSEGFQNCNIEVVKRYMEEF
ncbi:hypothetical protein [Methanobrevibacter sp.]|uniref:hypothetical protein n=1 Tax=Methanobrevibacter sp. TaxID=66852 RepID=UPI00386BBBC8